jgi:hypothetical protein
MQGDTPATVVAQRTEFAGLTIFHCRVRDDKIFDRLRQAPHRGPKNSFVALH